MNTQAGFLIAAALAADGLRHAYWTTGHLWPARDLNTLSRAVLNVDISFATPGVFALACALLLLQGLARLQVEFLGTLDLREVTLAGNDLGIDGHDLVGHLPTAVALPVCR